MHKKNVLVFENIFLFFIAPTIAVNLVSIVLQGNESKNKIFYRRSFEKTKYDQKSKKFFCFICFKRFDTLIIQIV